MGMASAPKHLLLYQLRDELMEALCANAGRHYQGMAAAARSSTLPRHVKNKIAKLDFAYNLVRHITAESANAYVADIATMLGAPVKHEEVKDKERDALYDHDPWPSWAAVETSLDAHILLDKVGASEEEVKFQKDDEQEANDTIDVAMDVQIGKKELGESTFEKKVLCDTVNAPDKETSVQAKIELFENYSFRMEGGFAHGVRSSCSASSSSRNTRRARAELHAATAAAEAAAASAVEAAVHKFKMD